MKETWRKYRMIAIVAAVTILPFIYSYLYLWAFWDPYSNMGKLPIAVVNEDVGAKIDGKHKNIGNQVVDELKENDDVKWVFTSAEDAKEGLENRRYYGEVLFPKEFSQNVSTLDKESKVESTFEYKINEKRNFLAGQVMNKVSTQLKEKVSKGITEEVIGKITDEMKKLPDSLKKLDDGVSKLHNGVVKLDKGALALYEGTDKISKGTGKLNESMSAMNKGIKEYTQGTVAYVEGVEQMSESQAKIAELLQAYLLAHPEAMKDGNVQSAVKIMIAGKEGVNQLAEGGKRLKESSSTLGMGSEMLAKAVSSLNDGSKSLNAGALALSDGSQKIKDGSGELKSKVGDALSEAKEKTKNIEGLDKAATSPVDIKENKVNPVPDYGTAFAPYFVSLSLWVGALMIFFVIYLDTSVRFRRRQSDSKGIVRYLAYTLIGVAQAVIVAFSLRQGLHIEVKNVALYYASCILVAVVFVSIMRFLLVHLQEVGKFLAILLLILQLTSCGGLFPMELLPSFFNKIGTFMPMTYSLNLLKEVISGIDYGYFMYNFKVLVSITVVFAMLNIVFAQIRRRKNPNMPALF